MQGGAGEDDDVSLFQLGPVDALDVERGGDDFLGGRVLRRALQCVREFVDQGQVAAGERRASSMAWSSALIVRAAAPCQIRPSVCAERTLISGAVRLRRSIYSAGEEGFRKLSQERGSRRRVSSRRAAD
jgi:hypothetical protein